MRECSRPAPPADPLAALRARIRALAEELNGKIWRTVKRELLATLA